MDGWLGRLDRSAVSALGWLAVRPRWAAAFLVTLCLALNLPGIATLPVTDRDEARFAQATKQMLETGDFIDIRFQNDPRYKKPVGAYWLQAASVKAVRRRRDERDLGLSGALLSRHPRGGAADLVGGEGRPMDGRTRCWRRS